MRVIRLARILSSEFPPTYLTLSSDSSVFGTIELACNVSDPLRKKARKILAPFPKKDYSPCAGS